MATFTITKATGTAIIEMFNKYVSDIIERAAKNKGWWSFLYTDPTVDVQAVQNSKILWLTDNLDAAVDDVTDNYAALSRWLSEARSVDNYLRNTAGYNYNPDWGNLDSILKKPLLGPSTEPGMDILDVADNAAREVTGAAFKTVEKVVDWSGKTIGGFVGSIVEGMGPGGMFILTVVAIVVVGGIIYKKS